MWFNFFSKGTVRLRVSSFEAILTNIIPHFDNYPLQTQNLGGYLLFRQVAIIINSKEHLTKEGLLKIANIRAASNTGFQANTLLKVKNDFPKLKPVERPVAPTPNILIPNWIEGFSSAEQIKINLISSSETRLVVWGTNLSSSVGLGKFSKQVSNIIKIPPFHISVIVGLLLSDGWLIFGSKTNKDARLGFQQSLAHSGYFWSVFNVISHYCSSMPTFCYGSNKWN